MQVFPDVDPERGAYRLLLVNLDSILSSDAKVTSLNIDAEGVGVTRAGHRDPALPGVEEEPAGTYSWELESPPGR